VRLVCAADGSLIFSEALDGCLLFFDCFRALKNVAVWEAFSTFETGDCSSAIDGRFLSSTDHTAFPSSQSDLVQSLEHNI
jgi:hypothetical protein